MSFWRAKAVSIVPSASTAPGVATLPAPATEFLRWSVDQYHEILRAGILTESEEASNEP